MERMSDNTSQRKALQQLEGESDYDRITYYQKPFMVLWAAVQEASSELQDDYVLSPSWRSCGLPSRFVRCRTRWWIVLRKRLWLMANRNRM